MCEANNGNKRRRPTRHCYRCGKDVSGFMVGIKLDGQNYICGDCYPRETRLMRQKSAVSDDTKARFFTRDGVEALIRYRSEEESRKSAFRPSACFFDAMHLDEENSLFKIEGYEEVFPVNQIRELRIGYSEKNGEYLFGPILYLQNDIYFAIMIPEVHYKSYALLKKNRNAEFQSYIERAHQAFCPNAALTIRQSCC